MVLYIINSTKYKKYLEKGKYKYIFPLFTPKFKGQVLEEIIVGDKVKGKIAGINLKPIDYEDENSLKSLILNINKLKDETTKKIYLEDMSKCSLDIKNRIERGTGLLFPKQLDLKLSNIKYILKEIMEKKKFLSEQEVLIICNDKYISFKIIDLLYEEFSYLSIFSNAKDGKNLCEEILNHTGLSVFQVREINKSIKNYGIIINVEDEIDIDLGKIGRNAIIFDFSDKCKFRDRKDYVLIEDVSIKNNFYTKSTLLPKEIPSSLYEYLTGNNIRYSNIYSRGRLYTLDECIRDKDKLEGKM